MDIELPLHRIIFYPDLELEFPRHEITMDVLPTLLFVEEAIDYFLQTRLLIFTFTMPVDLTYLRQRIPDLKFFDNVIGRAISHECATHFAFGIADSYGFSLQDWSELQGIYFRKYTQHYMDIVRITSKPVNLGLIHMISFAAVLSYVAAQIGRVPLMYNLIWAVVHKLGERFPYQWIYENLHHWALTYNFRHNDLHDTWTFENDIEEGLDEVVDSLFVCWRS